MSRASSDAPVLSRAAVTRLWLHRQGLLHPRTVRLTRRRFVQHLEQTGGLQVDSINVLDRAHYLTLWSRFGPYARKTLDRWLYDERVGYEYWGHEASILPSSSLPLSRRRMRSFPPGVWANRAWWQVYETSSGSKRRVLRRLRAEGPLESVHFDGDDREFAGRERPGGVMPLPKEDKRSLRLLWHAGKIAIRTRRSFRCVYDLAERVYPAGPAATTRVYEDSWLLHGLRANGVASERHLTGYFTAPELPAADRRAIIERNVKRRTIREVRVEGLPGKFFARVEDLDQLDRIPEPAGTTLVCPFDSLLWQRQRAEDLLGFRYRVEIYVPAKKRTYGYYVLPILHEGRLVGRVDPKLHRDRDTLEIRSVWFEPGFAEDPGVVRGLRDAIASLAEFVGAARVEVPSRWSRGLG